jgi:hypothetical protein
MGDGRTYTDGMTADYFSLPHEFLGRAATRIINELRGINRVVCDITLKPPWTIAWEWGSEWNDQNGWSQRFATYRSTDIAAATSVETISADQLA